MTPDAPDIPEEFDADLRQLFAAAQPDTGFEDRLVNAVRQHRRLHLTIPPAVVKAAIAAAAVLAVGVTGYVGSQAINGNLHFAMEVNRAKSTANLHQIGLAIPLYTDNDQTWDYGGGSDSSRPQPHFNDPDSLIRNSPDAWHGWPDYATAGKPEWPGEVQKKANESQAIAGDTTRSGGSSSSPNNNPDSLWLADRLPTASGNWGPPALLGRTYPISAGPAPSQTLRENLVGSNPAANKSAYSGLDSMLLPNNGGYGGEDVKTPPAQTSPQIVGSSAASGGRSGTPQPIDGETTSPPAVEPSSSLATNTKDETLAVNSPTATPPSANAANGLLGGLSLSHDSEKAQSRFNPRDFAAVPPSDGPTDLADEHKPEAPQVVAEAFQPPPIETVKSPDAVVTENQGPAPSTPASTQPAADDRKIIRTGTMEFDVDRFDTAQIQITKIVAELGGFVGATDSQKLPNGKVRGSITVRVPPERLDTLVLSLRALGDLKNEQITSQDISKEYTDLESELAADRAMQDRLLELIHDGKGSVKDLLAAENELGTWREKIEKAEGMIRYYNAQVAMSTLTITLSERDIQTPATAIDTETADMGIEADDVEKARDTAMKAIDDVKGRIVEAELKRFDAGQLAARLVADVPPESAGAVIDQLKMLGKVARLEINRQQTPSDGSAPVTTATPLRTERKATRLVISIYNLANVAPRRTTNVTLAANDVEAAYTALANAARSGGGRIVTSNLDRGDPAKTTGSLVLEFPPDRFEPAMTTLHAQGEVLKLALTENPDTQNSTEAKQGLTVQLVSLAAVPPREAIQQTLAATDVPAAYQSVLSAISAAHARVQSAQLNEQDRQNISADVQLEIPRSVQADFDKALAAAGATISRTSTQSAQTEGTVDSKVQLHLTIAPADHLPPRETTKLQIEAADVDKSAADAQAAAIANGGRVLESTVTKDHGKGLARLILDVPLEKSTDMLQQLRAAGTVRGIDSSRDPQAPTGPLAHAQFYVEFASAEAIVADQTGPWASIRQGLSTSITGLLWSLQWVVVGLCLIGPWAAVGYVGWRLWRRRGTKFEERNLEASNQ